MSCQERDLDRRLTSRLSTSKGARIIGANGYPVQPCTVRNLSVTGAMLLIDNGPAAGERFLLLLDSDRRPRLCEVAWVSRTELGVRFLPAAPTSGRAPA